ncbi:hypothetical protein [Candidatus Nitrospira salsa]
MIDSDQMIDFHEIRSHEGDKRKGFEELVCQLARREYSSEKGECRRVEGAGGDGGVEVYWSLEDDTKHGYQAKYFLYTKDIDWSQIDKSVKTAIEQHPELRKYTIALACDLTDKSGKLRRGKTGWKHWDTHKTKWNEWAKAKEMDVEFIPWTKSDITDKLVSNTTHRGLILFWFNTNLFDQQWFTNIFERVKADLGERFQPEDHVEVDIAKAFEGLARSPAYLQFLSNWFNNIPDLSDLHDAIKRLDSVPDGQLTEYLENRYLKLKQTGKTVYSFNANPFPLRDWADTIASLIEAIQQIDKWLHNQDNKGSDSLRDWKRRGLECLNTIESYLDHTPFHLRDNSQNEISVEADSRQVLLVVGEAGSGKSHLFADSVFAVLNNGSPAILVLGQNFPGRDIRHEFLSYLDLRHHDFLEVLQALNASGEASKTRLIILIDALNETQNLRIWQDQLSGFVSDILKYKWLSVGLSLRPEYEDCLIPGTLRKKIAYATCCGIQSPQEKEQAAIQYLEKRGIIRPALPWIAPEFSNFLFLKTCCDSLRELGISEFPKGMHGSLQVLDFYLKKIDRKLRNNFPGIQIPSQAVQNSIRRIAKLMAENKTDYINELAAMEVCEVEFGSKGPNTQLTWFFVLTKEGAFRRDHIFSSESNDPLQDIEEIFRFTYQRFSDHLIAQDFLDKVDNVDDAFQPHGQLGFLFEKHKLSSWMSLLDALAVQIPEKFFGKELPDVLPDFMDERLLTHSVFGVFEQSLLWRSKESFSTRTLELFSSIPNDWNDPKLIILVRLAVLRDHPWNAEFLNKKLQDLPMAMRDAFWTIKFNHLSKDNSHPIWELIRWGLEGDLQHAEVETLRLAAITLGWVLSSSNRPIRDTATKALISIFIIRPELIADLLQSFRDVDDLYVMERLCAAVLGAITRDMSHEHIHIAARVIYQTIFADETPPLNINLRDYARAAVEYAFVKGYPGDDIDIEKCRPPYNSQWPLDDVMQEEVENIAEASGDKAILRSALTSGDFERYEIRATVRHFTNISLSQVRPLIKKEKQEQFKAILATWDSQKQEAYAQFKVAIDEKNSSLRVNTRNDNKIAFPSHSYAPNKIERVNKCKDNLVELLSESEKKTFQDLIHPIDSDLPPFDTSFAKRWITKRAYSFGWNKKRFPSDRDQGYGRSRPIVERIGKKYQWLALHELLARLTDNVWTIGGWPERAKRYDHPAEGWFVRDVEPSFLLDPKPLNNNNPWWPVKPLELHPVSDECLSTWPSTVNPPNTSDWLNVVSESEIPWILLHGFFRVREERKESEVIDISSRREIFVRVSTILVQKDAVCRSMSQLHKTQLSDSTGLDPMDRTDGPYLCEYPWSNTWSSHREDYEDNGFGNLAAIKYIRPVTRHVWESHLDTSLTEGSSIYIPDPWIGQKLGLGPNLDHVGEFISNTDGKTVFLDPTVGTTAHPAALIDRKKFFDFLESEKLECLWIVAGEINAWPSGKLGDYSCRSFASICRWRRKKWEVKKWHIDTSS